MKDYISIPKKIIGDIDIYAFNKYDGQQVRALWTRKNGIERFGTKNRLLGTDQGDFLQEVPDLIKFKYEKSITDFLKKKGHISASLFLEFYGENSFAGQHKQEKHNVILFDIAIDKQEILEPNELIKLEKYNIEVCPLLYYGKANSIFEESVRNSTLEGMSLEGVVCKGKRDKKTKIPVMFKIKTRAWLEKLKEFCGQDDKKFEELA